MHVANLEVVQVPNIVSNLLTQYNNIFKMLEYLELVIGVEYIIKTTQDLPFSQIYNILATELAALKEYLVVALDHRWITYSTSSAGSLILFVPKKDGRLQIYVNYYALNTIIVKNYIALLLISKILNYVIGAQYFSKINLEVAFYYISIQQ